MSALKGKYYHTDTSGVVQDDRTKKYTCSERARCDVTYKIRVEIRELLGTR